MLKEIFLNIINANSKLIFTAINSVTSFSFLVGCVAANVRRGVHTKWGQHCHWFSTKRRPLYWRKKNDFLADMSWIVMCERFKWWFDDKITSWPDYVSEILPIIIFFFSNSLIILSRYSFEYEKILGTFYFLLILQKNIIKNFVRFLNTSIKRFKWNHKH